MDISEYFLDVIGKHSKGKFDPSHQELDEMKKILLMLDKKYRDGQSTGLTDDEYDQLHSIYTELTGDIITGEDDERNVRVEHDYPNLKGTLTKVHYVTVLEQLRDPDCIKEYKTLEEWVRKTYQSKGTLGFYKKFDGTSVVLSLDEERRVTKAVTRGYSDSDIGVDKTSLFGGLQINGIVPDVFDGKKVGLKIEALVSTTAYEEMNKKYFNNELADARAAAVSLLSATEWTKQHSDYLTLAPLMIECEGKLYPIMEDEWGPVVVLDMKDIAKKNLPDTLTEVITKVRKKIGKQNFPCDGIVVRWLDEESITKLGRNHSRNVNNFETALKFRPTPYYSTIVDIIQDIGYLGNVSYTAVFNPIQIDGRNISHASIGSLGRMKMFNFAKGDMCRVTLNTVPRIGVDQYTNKMNSQWEDRRNREIIKPITHCPYCHEKLELNDGISRCTNSECPSRVMGKIYNFIQVMKVKGIGPETIEDLFHAKIVTKIEDLFSLKDHFSEIIELDGYGPIAADNIISAMKKIKGSEAQVLGSLGIPGIKIKKAQLLIDSLGMDRILQLEFQTHIIEELTQLKGFGATTAKAFLLGITANKDLLKFLLQHIHILKSEPVSMKVVFTGFRNPDFEKHLMKGGIGVDDSITKNTGLVIALNPNATSGKLKKAKEAGIPILSLVDAYEKFNFKM